jgi:hypothetical protein
MRSKLTTELQSGDQILVGVNQDSARVIGQMTVKDGTTHEEWLTIAVPRAAMFRLADSLDD